MFRQTISAIVRVYYGNIKGETGKTKKEVSPFTIFFKPELIILISRNNKILFYLQFLPTDGLRHFNILEHLCNCIGLITIEDIMLTVTYIPQSKLGNVDNLRRRIA